jgi:pimeloyl-ACP methyl ester carboxylesterase
MGQRETVVLVHGLWMRGWFMSLLAWRLRRAGYQTICFSYPSMSGDLHANAVLLQERLAGISSAAIVHFVGHSLGCLVIRSLFHYFPRQRAGRIVMLAPPNRGSMAAQELAMSGTGRAVLGKSIMDMIAGVPRQWPAPPREIGVISGTVPVGLGRLVTTLPVPNDGALSVNETLLPGSQAQLSLPVTHAGVLVSGSAASAVVNFLRRARFS